MPSRPPLRQNFLRVAGEIFRLSRAFSGFFCFLFLSTRQYLIELISSSNSFFLVVAEASVFSCLGMLVIVVAASVFARGEIQVVGHIPILSVPSPGGHSATLKSTLFTSGLLEISMSGST